MIRREREQILFRLIKKISARLQKILKVVLDADQICVIGSEEKIEEQKRDVHGDQNIKLRSMTEQRKRE